MLSPSHSTEVHAVAADVLKGIIALATPSPGNFPANPGAMSMLGSDPSMTLPLSNRLARELAHKDNVTKLVGFMLDGLPFAPASTSDDLPSSGPIDTTNPLSNASAISSLVNIIPVFIELIRKNNADFHEPYLFHTLRNRLIQVQQQQQFSHHKTSEEDDREELEKAMEEMVDHLGMVHLGCLLEIIGSRLADFQQLLNKPRSSVGELRHRLNLELIDSNTDNASRYHHWVRDTSHLRTLPNMRTLRGNLALFQYDPAQSSPRCRPDLR